VGYTHANPADLARKSRRSAWEAAAGGAGDGLARTDVWPVVFGDRIGGKSVDDDGLLGSTAGRGVVRGLRRGPVYKA